MATVRLRHDGKTWAVHVASDSTLRDGLDSTGPRVRSGCNGNGSCGLCRVRIIKGEVSAPTAAERVHLSSGQQRAGVRLACQTFAVSDVEMELLSPAPSSPWRSIPREALASAHGPPAQPGLPANSAVARVALDIGTTNLCLTLWNASPAHRVAARRGPNPQARFGSDVVTRLSAARDSEVASRLAEVVQQAVFDALLDTTTRQGVCLAPVLSILAVGNTAMLGLIQGECEGLLEPRNWASSAPLALREHLRWESAGLVADVKVVPPLAGFVGSDLLADVIAADLTSGECPALLVDFGTNSELALWDGHVLWVTSAAGGPAFESNGMQCALPGDPGAIYRVRQQDGALSFEVIGGGEPEGVCGSGLVDWMACLVRSGALSARGSFMQDEDRRGVSLGNRPMGWALSKRDVDGFQRAKAAIGAGVTVLCGRAGVVPAELKRVVTTGLFGRHLDVANAQAIGLLPLVSQERVEAHENLALLGCERMLLSPESTNLLAEVRSSAQLLNLAVCPEFEERFMASLFLAPLRGA